MYIAERTSREELLDLLSILPITHDMWHLFANKAQHIGLNSLQNIICWLILQYVADIGGGVLQVNKLWTKRPVGTSAI
jgi:hypothetical protein